MKPIQSILLICLIILCILCISCSSDDSAQQEQSSESIYFPSLNSEFWETKSITELNWNEDQLQPLLNYLEEKNSKGFIILHQGKIVVEVYFNGHTSTSPWYWASAGKTLTTTVTGIAQDEGLLNINIKVSDYLGTGLSTHQFSQLLNDNLGKNFALFINEYRIESAKLMLQNNNKLTLEAIGYECGFNSKSTFFTTFKKLVGTTPAKFRKQK